VNGKDPMGTDVFFVQNKESGGHAWVGIGGDAPKNSSTYGAWPMGHLFGHPEFIQHEDPHKNDDPDDYTFKRYKTTLAEETKLDEWIKKNYDINDTNSKKNPNYNFGWEDCRSFSHRVEAELEKIMEKDQKQ